MDIRTAAGFLGTKAYLGADITLVAYLLMIVPGMILGFIFARRKLFVPHHKYMMTTIVIVNWVLIAVIMSVSYRNFVAPSVPDKLNDPGILTPSVHLLFGGLAQILGTILVIRMWFEYRLPRFLRFEPIKPWMRLTLACWLIAATLGVLTYINWYGVPFMGAPADTTTVATPEATPEATAEATGEATVEAQPEGTPEATPEATAEATAEATPEVEPAATPAPTQSGG